VIAHYGNLGTSGNYLTKAGMAGGHNGCRVGGDKSLLINSKGLSQKLRPRHRPVKNIQRPWLSNINGHHA
jgi:hypothetical protein